MLFSSCGKTLINFKNPEALASVFLFIYLFLLCQKEVQNGNPTFVQLCDQSLHVRDLRIVFLFK